MLDDEKYSLRSVYTAIKEEVHHKALACGRNPEEVSLVAVSKGYSEEFIQELYQLGQREFAENRLVEGAQKMAVMPDDCVWHFVGHLQSKKLEKILFRFGLIHSVDNFEIAQKISRIAGKLDRNVSLLLQVNTSGENTKQGLSAEEWESVLDDLNHLPNLCIEGLMTMAPYTQDEHVIRMCFRTLAQLRDKWKGRMLNPAIFHHLSMGMSNDYLIAIEEGATLLRIGTALFKW